MARIGVSGIGSIGLRHARLLADLGIEVVLHDVRPQGLELPRELEACARWVTTFDDLLASAVDGVVIATPDHVHVEQVAAACAHGVPVLVEKPLAETLAAARRLEAVVEPGVAPILVGYVLRYVSVLRRARELVDDGVIGAVVSVAATLGAYETLELARNRFGGDTRFRILVDYSHEWDYLRWIVGPIERVVAVAHLAEGRPLRQDPNVVDGVLAFAGGATGTFHLDYVRSPGTRSFTLIGNKGTLAVNVGRGELELRVYDGDVSVTEELSESRDVSFVRQLQHFLAVIQGDERPDVTLQDGLRALAVAEAIEASCTGGVWVEVGC